MIRRVFFSLLIAIFLLPVPKVLAADVLGIHILGVGELAQAALLLKTDNRKDEWHYVTIPLTLKDTQKPQEWQHFFTQARENKFQPIVRLTTSFEKGVWKMPTRKDIVQMAEFLDALEWPQDTERIVVIGNEPNHRAEWGGTLNPEQYAETLSFAADWFHTYEHHYVVLPAGLDLSANNSKSTMDAFQYLERMLAFDPELLEKLDGWTSHSYPNPAFSGKPTDVGRQSIRGYQTELAFLKKYTQKDFPVYITETGWIDNRQTSRWLSAYYEYANANVWSDPRIRAVTPFLLQGRPGPFAMFSFLDEQGKPTLHYQAYRRVLERL